MRRRNRDLKDFPPGVRYAILFYMFAWLFFIGSRIYTTGTVSVLHMSMAMFLSLLVYSQRNWGRILAAVYTIAMAVMVGIEMYYVTPDSDLPLSSVFINGMSGLIFMASSLLLLFGESNKFYKEHGI